MLNARVEPELKRAFQRASFAMDRSVSQLLRGLVREFVHRYQQGEIWEPGVTPKRETHIQTPKERD